MSWSEESRALFSLPPYLLCFMRFGVTDFFFFFLLFSPATTMRQSLFVRSRASLPACITLLLPTVHLPASIFLSSWTLSSPLAALVNDLVEHGRLLEQVRTAARLRACKGSRRNILMATIPDQPRFCTLNQNARQPPLRFAS